MARKLDKVSATLGKMLKARGLERSLSEYRILGQWEKAVGTVIASHARPQSLHGKKLSLIVDSPAWMQQLSLLKPELIKKLNTELGKEAIRDITLKLGEVVSSPKNTPDVVLPRAPLSLEERAEIETCIQEIHDPEIKAVLRRIIEKDLLQKKEQ